MVIKKKKVNSRTRASRPGAGGAGRWVLRLYIAGESSRSATALRNLNAICENQLKGKYRIEVIDLLKNPRLARDNQILAVPTLVRKLPLPVRNIIGDLSNTDRVLVGLDLVERAADMA